MKIGIYGGSFNPPHIGHISALKSYIKQLKLDLAIVVPCGKPSHKKVEDLISDEDRITLCKLAFGKIAEISDYEIKSSGLSYTVNTLEYYRTLYPDDELFILIGDDMLLSFDTWYKPDRICELCSVCYISRGLPDSELSEKAAVLSHQFNSEFINIRCKPVVVSSTEIRNLIENDNNADKFLTCSVYKYIKGHGLYND